MSFIVNIFDNDTIKYWDEKLKNKWYRIPFIMTKNIEIKAFKEEHKEIRDYPEKIDVSVEESNYQNKINEDSKIAIVVPVYIKNKFQYKQLKRLVDHLLNQTVKADQIIIVNDCSPYQLDLNEEVTLINLKENKGPANARNSGIKEALNNNMDIVVFTDSDVVPKLDWIK